MLWIPRNTSLPTNVSWISQSCMLFTHCGARWYATYVPARRQEKARTNADSNLASPDEPWPNSGQRTRLSHDLWKMTGSVETVRGGELLLLYRSLRPCWSIGLSNAGITWSGRVFQSYQRREHEKDSQQDSRGAQS